MQVKEQFTARYVNLSSERARPEATQFPKPVWGGRRVPGAGEKGLGRWSRTFLFSERWALASQGCCLYKPTPSGSVPPALRMEGGLTGDKIHRETFYLLEIHLLGSIDQLADRNRLLWASGYVISVVTLPYLSYIRLLYLSCDHGRSPKTSTTT